MAKKQKQKRRGGSRPGAGRKAKPDSEKWGYVTCSLRKETIAKARAGAASIYIGEFLQKHIDRYPLPTREEFLALENGDTSAPDPAARAAARAARAAARDERLARRYFALSKGEQKLVKAIQKQVKRDGARKVVPS